MAKRDLQDIKEEVRARADIVEIIGGYTQLKPGGKVFTGLCPFHADKNPSFRVSRTFQSYRCWSCGEKGDVFTFLQKKENLTFVEALEMLARRVGVPFERTAMSQERISEREEMHELNSLAVSYFRDRIGRSDEAKDYLAGRAILKETQDRFDIGFAQQDWEGLTSYLQRRRANLALAVKIGLIRERKETQGYIDYYRNRIMFPIHDRSGNVAGFGGRSMGDEQPKYINSPQSDIFNKSGLLYGLYFARQKLSADAPPVFVEGYTDVVTTHQAGFTQCVATLGTAMTEIHARMLVNYSHKVILCYDGDTAGINATLRGADVWNSMGVEDAEILVAQLPFGDDPDSMLRRGDASAFQLALDHASNRVDFEIALVLRRHETNTPEGRMAALDEIIPVLRTLRGKSILFHYEEQVSWLEPWYSRDPVVALKNIHARIQADQSSSNGTRSRQLGPTESVELQNRQPLQNQPVAKSSDSFVPNTQNWLQARSKSDGGYRKSGRFEDPGPPSDRTPPSLNLPALSAAEKAEYTLLRALFTGEWRSFILNKMSVDSFVSDQARELALRIVDTQPNSDGEINPLDVIRLIERESLASDEALAVQPDPPEMLPYEQPDSITGIYSAKMSNYLRDVVEDSETVLSNEPLNEATILGCLRRLEEYRAARAIRDLKETLKRDDLTEQQSTDYTRSLMELMRAHRGSATGS